MRKVSLILFALFTIFFGFTSCEEDKEPVVEPEVEPGITAEQRRNINTNKWLYEEMDLYYLWTDEMPTYSSSLSDPHDYFETLLYSEKDKWSYLAEDYKTWINSLNGISKSLGYSLALYYKDDKQLSVVAFVEFVYNDTPAQRAGIKRGDIIVLVNGKSLVLNDYYELLFETDHAVITLADYNNGVYEPADTTITVNAEEIEENPVLYYEIIEKDNFKIGYLVYVGYISSFNDNLNEAFAFFKENGIDELVLDLRYNPGGDLGAARELCSSIAPLATISNEEVLVRYNWNTELQEYIESEAETDESWNDNLRILFDKDVENNLNLEKLYALTTKGSASASELTLTGLDPYMEVIQIGGYTSGKYTASITLPDEDSLWAIQPIVLKYSNANGVTDFESGFKPDYSVADVLDYEFGDIQDPMLKKALELIIGRPITFDDKSASMSSRQIGEPIFIGGRHKMIQQGMLDVTKSISR